MINTIGQRKATYYTSDIDGKTGHVEIADQPGNRTTI